MIKWFVILVFLLKNSSLNAQKKSEYMTFLQNNVSFDFSKNKEIEKIYFVRFDYCSGTDYCGKNDFHKLLDESEMKTSLFVIDTLKSKSKLPTYMLNKQILYVNREKLMRKGLFSNHTILIETNKKKIKKLK